MTMDMTWKRPDFTSFDQQEIINNALVKSGTVITLQDASLNYLFAANLPADWQIANDLCKDDDLFGPELASKILPLKTKAIASNNIQTIETVSYTHLRAHETDSYLVCRLLLEKKKK